MPTAKASATSALDFLIQPDQHYTDHEAAWKREERRLFGGDPVLEELTTFVGEDTTSFDLRKRTARYLNFPDLHTSILSGHLRRAMPVPEFGSMGEFRARAKQGGAPTLAELFWYNCDGIGQDGTQFPAWMDGVVKRACATGYRLIMIEMPTAATLTAIRLAGGRDPTSAAIMQDDIIGGFHPWLVEYSPLDCVRRRIRNGVLEYAVLRVPLVPDVDLEDTDPDATAWYVLVRAGYRGLGSLYQEGGWWLYDADQRPLGHGLWDTTNGQIPLVRAMSESSLGTWEKPALARSLTMELGQIAIDVMNARSEQRYNARQAAKSINWLLGADADAQKVAAAQSLAGSILVAVPPVMNKDGSYVVPQMWNSSAAALDTSVYTAIIAEALSEAREIMVKQVTSEPGSSGESKAAGFEEANMPLLARLAVATETWVNSVLYFYALRAGLPQADATLTMPRDFNIRQVLDDVDNMLDTIRRSALSSPTWEMSMIVRKGDQLGLIPDDDRAVIEGELQDAAVKKQERAAQEEALMDEVRRAGFGGNNGDSGQPPKGGRVAAALGGGVDE
jgi:hypothetical protein